MKIALLTKYGNMAASTRQRFHQFCPYLIESGFEIKHLPLLENKYLENLYKNNHYDRTYVAMRYLNRLHWLANSSDISAVWLHCECFPYLPGFFERLVRLPRAPIIFDYDDAIFHNYDLHPNRLVRWILARKLQVTIGVSDLALCGNTYLADYARHLTKQVQIVPTVLDTEVYFPRPAGSLCNDFKINVLNEHRPLVGWIGTPSTWSSYMDPMMPLLTDIAAAHGGRVIAVGAGKAAAEHTLLDNLPWSEETEVACIQEMDIGIMPLSDTPWARGKCGYKLIQYMACGLPVIASPVGVNAEIVEHGVNGFLASTEEEWRAALVTLLRDPGLRQRMGAEGRRKVEREYSLAVWGPKVAAMLRAVAVGRVAD